MSDFAATYERFLDLIQDDTTRGEVTEYVAKMSAADPQTPEYADAHRGFVRVLKSRAPQVLPASWRDDPLLEDARVRSYQDDVRKAWKESMEADGVFSFGRVPTFEDIDKHYGEGDHRHPSKTHHAKPTQRVHGNELGVRHMVARIAALPEFRNQPEKLAEFLGKPADTPFRELVRFEGDEDYKARVKERFESKFRGAELEEATEGTGLAGENFKLSAGRARGRQADEHQDPVVRQTDAPARLDDARRAASGDDGEGAAGESVEKAKDLVSRAGDQLDEQTQNILKHLARFESRTSARTVNNAFQQVMTRTQKNMDAAFARMRGGDPETLLSAMEAAQEAMTERSHAIAALELRLRGDDAMREEFSEAFESITKVAQHAVALDAASRAVSYQIQHQDNMRDAGDHERVAGPDGSDDTYSFYVPPIQEGLALLEDIVTYGAAEDRVRFDPTPAREEAPAEAKPSRLPVGEKKPAAEAKPNAVPDERVGDDVAERLRERGLGGYLGPAAGGDGGGTRDKKEAEQLIRDELAQRGKKLREGQLKLATELLMEDDDTSAAEALDMLPESAFEKPGMAPPTDVPDKPATGRVPPARLGEIPSGDPKAALEAMSRVPSSPKRQALAQLEDWRRDLRSKIKDEGARQKEEASLAERIGAIADGSPTERHEALVDILRDFSEKHGLEARKMRLTGPTRSGGQGSAAAEAASATAGSGSSRSNNFGGMMARGNKGSGKRPPIAGDKDWRRGMKKRLPLNPRRFPVGESPSTDPAGTES